MHFAGNAPAMVFLERDVSLLMWLPIGWGISVHFMRLHHAHLVCTGQVTPDAEVCREIDAPSLMDTVKSVSIGGSLVIYGFAVRAKVRKSMKTLPVSSGDAADLESPGTTQETR